MSRSRLDAELVRRGLARSREDATDLIEARAVRVGGIPATKPATQVDAETSITVETERDDFVSRGGHKLAGALEDFPKLIVAGKRALDAVHLLEDLPMCCCERMLLKLLQ